ncbi:hypothetical protein OsJ_27694 [Oryza sativa Japonica Group]|uniref:Uncharacterized protein n=1 Tax=Oryza sativa subsp. japonica TaxID=39947 RepID=Q6Z237_ORYSJ|nr:zinc finger protein 526-like [Oryza sativa Japonica Group]EAZ43103.1 hypothetical protein OsJ_27694 [Oryza sativa Japonica Group]BAD10277.1 hypothetical protein [Oryza sativa Japonica Group]
MGFSPWAVKKGLLCGRTHSGRSSVTGSAATAHRRLAPHSPPPPPPPPPPPRRDPPSLSRSPSASADALSFPSRSRHPVRRRVVRLHQLSVLRLPVKIRHRAAVLRRLRLLFEIHSTAQPFLCKSVSATKGDGNIALDKLWHKRKAEIKHQ